jgi:MFS superfamily sulfate permease-like transporter
VSTSGSRTAVAEQAGAKTQVTGLVGAVAITLILLLAPGMFRNLPQPTLAAVVIAAALSLADVRGTVRLLHDRPTEFGLSMAAFAGVVGLGVLPGIGVAVALSVGNVFRRTWWPYQTVLGRVPEIPGYHDVRSYPTAEQLPGCRIFRFDAPVIFANARTFREQIQELARSDPPPKWIIIAAEPITDVDTTGGPGRGAQRERDQPGVRRTEGPGPQQGQPVRAHPRDRSCAFLPHAGRGRDGISAGDRHPVEPDRARLRKCGTAKGGCHWCDPVASAGESR